MDADDMLRYSALRRWKKGHRLLKNIKIRLCKRYIRFKRGIKHISKRHDVIV